MKTIKRLSRREFAGSIAATALLSGLDVRELFAAHQAAVSSSAHDFYNRAFVLDCNSAPPLEEKLPFSRRALDMARDSGITAVKTSLGGFGSSFEDTVDEVAFIQALIETHPDYFLQVRKHNDFDGAKKEAKLGIIFSFEGVECLGGKLERIERFRHL